MKQKSTKQANDFTKLAKLICQKEGKKKQLDIAQVKEVLKIIFEEMSVGERQHWHYKTDSEICNLFLNCLAENIIKKNESGKQKNLAD